VHMGALWKLVVLIAVLLMPLGMQPAAASAAPIDHHAAIAGMVMEHCPDQPNKHDRNDGLAMCSMACASALPAQEMTRAETLQRDHQLAIPAMADALHGILPEIATPPPKFA
jgi:hypothetical protein